MESSSPRAMGRRDVLLRRVVVLCVVLVALTLWMAVGMSVWQDVAPSAEPVSGVVLHNTGTP